MEGLIEGVFADVLKANRESLNSKFAAVQRQHPGIDPEGFAAVLRQSVAPIVTAVEKYDAECAGKTALLLYDMSLSLLEQGFIGPQSRSPFITMGWTEILPNIPQQICAAPRLMIGSVTNALYNLSQVQDARPKQWIEIMVALAPLVADVNLYLQAGQVAAWRAGLAHFRAGALKILKDLPPEVICTILDFPSKCDAQSAAELVRQLEADPWLDPVAGNGTIRGQPRSLRIVRRVGAFRGFGGLFLQPPRVYSAGEHFLVVDGDTHWLLAADCFGATFHKVDGMQPESGLAAYRIDKAGCVDMAGLQQTFGEFAGYSSAASNGSTLAVTSPLSFAVSLVAPVGK